MASLAEKRIAEPEEYPVDQNGVDSSQDSANQASANPAFPNQASANLAATPTPVNLSQANPSLVDSNHADSNLADSNPVEPDPAEPQARPDELRLLEALLFAASEPLDQAALAKRMPDGVDIKVALAQLQADYASRGVNLVRVANKWTFRTAGDLSWLMTKEITETRRLSRAAIEVLSIIAYHQPVTRAEIEEIRGVVTSKGTLDVLLETGWIKPRGRRKTPGRPLTFGTTETFLSQFSLEALGDLPGLEELKGTGLLDSRLPTGFTVPNPSDDPTLREDEEPLEAGDLELTLAPPVEPEGEGES
jgi:segregation and condensation protein B